MSALRSRLLVIEKSVYSFKRFLFVVVRVVPNHSFSGSSFPQGGSSKRADLSVLLRRDTEMPLPKLNHASRKVRLGDIVRARCVLGRVIGNESLNEGMSIFDVRRGNGRTFTMSSLIAKVGDGLDTPPQRLIIGIIAEQIVVF